MDLIPPNGLTAGSGHLDGWQLRQEKVRAVSQRRRTADGHRFERRVCPNRLWAPESCRTQGPIHERFLTSPRSIVVTQLDAQDLPKPYGRRAEAHVGDVERAVRSEGHAGRKGQQATGAVDQDVLLPVVPQPEEAA